MLPPAAREALIGISVLLNDHLTGTLLGIALILAVSYWFREQKSIPFIAVALLFAILLALLFKPFLAEDRPCAVSPGKIDCPSDFALPSFHALLSFALAIASLGRKSFPIYLLFALFVSFTRIYLGVHTIPDVAAGLALAFIACVAAELAFLRAGWGGQIAIHVQRGRK